jgi:outer membrane protein assembly factor BamC
MFNKVVSILSYLLILLSIGCSDKPITLDDIKSIGSDAANIFGKDDSKDYGASKSIALLEVPPSLSNPNYDDSLRVPKSIDTQGVISDFSDATVLPSYIDMTVRTQGIARWLEIQSDPVSLWPYLRQFWISQGFEININEPINGILETKWKEKEINFDTKGNLINNKDFNFNVSREKFRLRIERQPGGSTNIYVTNHNLEADDVVDNGKIIWKKKNSDVSREAEFLVRIMEYLGTNRKDAVNSLNNSIKNEENIFIDMIDFFGVPAIMIKDSFSKIWREVGLSLDRSGLLITDQNRIKKIYTIDYDNTSYEIKLTKRDTGYIVTAHSTKNTKIPYENARNLLKHILSAYTTTVAAK